MPLCPSADCVLLRMQTASPLDVESMLPEGIYRKTLRGATSDGSQSLYLGDLKGSHDGAQALAGERLSDHFSYWE